MSLSRRLWLGVASAAAGTLASAAAQSPDGGSPGGETLDKAIGRGVLSVGVSLGTPPFGSVGAGMEPEGYDVGVARLLARELGVRAQIVDTVSADRIPSLLSGKVDLVISSFTVTSERARAIAFSNAVYVDQQVAVGPTMVAMGSVAEMRSQHIGVTRSTTNDSALSKQAPEGTLIQRYDDDAATNQALLSGQVQAIITSGAVAAAVRERSTGLALETKFVVSDAPMAVGLRHGEPELLHWVNTCLFMLWNSQELQSLQLRWMGTVNHELPRFG